MEVLSTRLPRAQLLNKILQSTHIKRPVKGHPKSGPLIQVVFRKGMSVIHNKQVGNFRFKNTYISIEKM